jgi:polyvinyl alcohol dehydrogenase (cytochrome)
MRALNMLWPVCLLMASTPAVAEPADGFDPLDWPTYNYDVAGTRHNVAERILNSQNVGRLELKWQYPPAGSEESIGVIHATPIVVAGDVYFGTATMPAVYKIGADGALKWKYTNPETGTLLTSLLKNSQASVPTFGFLGSPLVTSDTVFLGDAGGHIYALDRETGRERWKINTRAEPFPAAYPRNCIFASPIMAEGLLIVAGGPYEHAAAADPRQKCCGGRGFVAALRPESGEVVWKYDVGPAPQRLDPPVTIKDDWGERTFHYGPSTGSVWCTPSYDAETGLLLFGTDVHNSPRQPTEDDPRLYTEHSAAVIALDARTGRQHWVRQLNPDDIWNHGMRAWDSRTGRYKDQSIGDTPKLYTIDRDGRPTRVAGVGCKNGAFYVLELHTGKVLAHTPLYSGPPADTVAASPVLALPGPIGGLQTGCATDGRAVYTNGIDAMLIRQHREQIHHPPSGGRVVSISLDTRQEFWRHERPKVPAVGGSPEQPFYTDVGDPVASGIALAGGVAFFTTTVSNRLVALDAATGQVLKEIDLGPVWCGPSVSRGRVYVGSGNILFAPGDPEEAYFPKRLTGTLFCFGLPEELELAQVEVSTSAQGTAAEGRTRRDSRRERRTAERNDDGRRGLRLRLPILR